jgi:hypothetical protein
MKRPTLKQYYIGIYRMCNSFQVKLTLLLLLTLPLVFNGAGYLTHVTCPIVVVTVKDDVINYDMKWLKCVLLGEYEGEGSLDCTEIMDKMDLDNDLNPRIRHNEWLGQCKERNDE